MGETTAHGEPKRAVLLLIAEQQMTLILLSNHRLRWRMLLVKPSLLNRRAVLLLIAEQQMTLILLSNHRLRWRMLLVKPSLLNRL
ncbi:uncharacterized protein [Sinocyclocheilus grahami]|uniref:uncharacterized protein isoform X4 n=1 Tax=Sinocyclocheilus grahami TaxID=75366 RepID=UPI0007AD3D31|nr:PREDICTED: uncharacterized protein LOC107572902 isoform X4 [Sinocyclocheilus grahami]